ncbi:MAG: aminoacyl-tRNA hydrolase [Gemmatimonadota bacterium]
MKLLLAIGNPGDEYRDTRHNAGWWLADRLVTAWALPPFRRQDDAAESRGEAAGAEVLVVKPLTYVNRSGDVLCPDRLPDGFRPERDLLVLVDDVDLEPGAFRLRARGSAGGHRGLRSVESALGTREYDRLRIGVGRPRDAGVDADLASWVLAPPSPAEEERILSTFDRAVSAVECWLAEGVEEAMNRFN